MSGSIYVAQFNQKISNKSNYIKYDVYKFTYRTLFFIAVPGVLSRGRMLNAFTRYVIISIWKGVGHFELGVVTLQYSTALFPIIIRATYISTVYRRVE